ncbi:MAG TPA: protein-L-isoaspartate(D-aspartate) O-methyltransferase [Gemmatirosa sp.]
MAAADMPADMTAAEERAAMVQRLRSTGIEDLRVLAAMRDVPRELFVPPQLAHAAYHDSPLSIDLGQTISAPWIVAFSAAALLKSPDAHVLEVGTGSGYGAAVLSRCYRTVVTVERHPQLAVKASAALAALGITNVEVRTGDGAAGVPERAPFDGIVVTAMADTAPPPALLEQLSPEGTLICPVGRRRRGVLRRYRAGQVEDLVRVAFVPLVTGHG